MLLYLLLPYPSYYPGKLNVLIMFCCWRSSCISSDIHARISAAHHIHFWQTQDILGSYFRTRHCPPCFTYYSLSHARRDLLYHYLLLCSRLTNRISAFSRLTSTVHCQFWLLSIYQSTTIPLSALLDHHTSLARGPFHYPSSPVPQSRKPTTAIFITRLILVPYDNNLLSGTT